MTKVTRVTYRIVEDDKRENSTLLATCAVVLDDVFMLHDIRIMDGANGAYVAMPKRVDYSNKQHRPPYSESQKSTRDVYHPVDRDFHLYLTQTIIDGYFLCKQENREEYFPLKSGN